MGCATMTEQKVAEAVDLPIEWWDIDRLKPYTKNAKNHPKKQVQQLANSMREFGFAANKAIEVEPDGTIINGHGRRLGAYEAELKKVPIVVRSDLTPTQIKAYRLLDNRVAESTYDTELMSAEMIELQADSFDLTQFYDERDLEFLAGEDLGAIDLGAIGADIGEEVREYADATDAAIHEEDSKTVPVSKALGFTGVTGTQRRAISLMMTHIEAMTGLEGADALAKFAQETIEQ